MGLPSSHSTTLVSFSFFWLQMSLLNLQRSSSEKEDGYTASLIYLTSLGKSGSGGFGVGWEGFKGSGIQGLSHSCFTYYCILLYVLLFFLMIFKNENHKTSHGG